MSCRHWGGSCLLTLVTPAKVIRVPPEPRKRPVADGKSYRRKGTKEKHPREPRLSSHCRSKVCHLLGLRTATVRDILAGSPNVTALVITVRVEGQTHMSSLKFCS